MEQTIHRILVYSLYVFVIYIISYGLRDLNSCYISKHIQNVLVSPVTGNNDGFMNVCMSATPDIDPYCLPVTHFLKQMSGYSKDVL